MVISGMVVRPPGRMGGRAMAGFLKKLFGTTSSEAAPSAAAEPRAGPVPTKELGQPAAARATSAYFAAMVSMQKAIRLNDFETAAVHAKEGIRLLPRFVAETAQDFGRFDIRSIPCIDVGGRMFALIGDAAAQAELVRIVTATPELTPWRPALVQHHREHALVPRIAQAVEDHPGCLQSDLKEVLGEPDGRLTATLIGFLERAGRIVRVREGRAVKLHLGGSDAAPPPPVKVTATSHRSSVASAPLLHLDLSGTPLVTLPQAPARWEERGDRATSGSMPESFEVLDGPWSVLSVDRISKADRPDPAFRLAYPSGEGALVIDDLGKAEGLGTVAGAALLYDREGNAAATVGFDRDLYRIGVHPLGVGFVAMSRDCVLHAYGANLRLRFETTLSDAPEILAAQRRLQINDDEVRNHIRCVALSRSADRYLFTIVDEAWCVSEAGDCLWGVKLPVSTGWAPRAPSGRYGTSAEVCAGLALMSLSLPVTPNNLRTRYLQLAKQWHPDLNPQDASAAQRMKALNGAFELLTGIDASELSHDAGLRYYREIDRHELQIGENSITITMGFEASERSAADWIYAASFASASNGAYLAGYSGRVVHVDPGGKAVRVYDIGAVPRRIIDLNGYLYLLTHTRLYVLRDDALHALIDVADGGDLVMSSSGFGLLEAKQLRWFSSDGAYLGCLLSRDPIRRVYRADASLVVETRQMRCTLGGV